MTNYTSPEYEPSGVVTHFDGINRFGHTENAYEVIEGNRSDYIRGVLLIPGVVVSITILLFIILVVFACMCRKSCLSGRRIPKGQGAIIRTLFLFSTCVILISSILFLVKGGYSFIDAFDNVEGSKADLFQVVNGSINKLAEIRLSIGNFTETSQKLQNNIDGGVCEGLPQEVQNSLNAISTNLDTSDYTDQLVQLEEFENSFKESFTPKSSSRIDELLEKVETTIDVLKYVTLPHIFTTFLLGCGAVFSWCDIKSKIYYSILSSFIMPLFTLLVLISSVIISLLGILLIIFSDLCTGGNNQSPEGSIRIILDSMQLNEIARESLDYYIVDGCRATNPFGGLTETVGALEDISKEVNEAVDSVRGFFEVICSDYTELDTLLTKNNEHLFDLNNALSEALNFTECEKINSVYVTAVHEGVCRSTPYALSWLFGCFFVVWIGGLFMLISRAAYKPNRREDKRNNNDSKYFHELENIKSNDDGWVEVAPTRTMSY